MEAQPFEARAQFRVAIALSAENCLKAVEMVANCAGAASLFQSSPLARCLSDIAAMAGTPTAAQITNGDDFRLAEACGTLHLAALPPLSGEIPAIDNPARVLS